MSQEENVLVGIRLRPLNTREIDQGMTKIVSCEEHGIAMNNDKNDKYSFDCTFNESSNNEAVFTKIANHIVHAALAGINGTIFACKCFNCYFYLLLLIIVSHRWPNQLWQDPYDAGY